MKSWKQVRDSMVLLKEESWKPEEDLNIDWSGFLQAIEERDVSQAYTRFCVNFENMVEQGACKLSPAVKPGSFRGRSRPKIVARELHQGRIHRARNGDYQPSLDDGLISVRQHTRQIRRVQSASQHMRRAIGAPDGGSALQSARETWEAVISSKEYGTSFTSYCATAFGLNIPHCLSPEDMPLLQLLLQQLKVEETKWLSRLQALKAHTYKTRMQNDWKSGGRLHHLAIKPPPKPWKF